MSLFSGLNMPVPTHFSFSKLFLNAGGQGPLGHIGNAGSQGSGWVLAPLLWCGFLSHLIFLLPGFCDAEMGQ